MIKEDKKEYRKNRLIRLNADLVVTGGGMAGVCAAITAAREGAEVILIQDRPVLGGNASSEVRLWILGATSHLGSNNRWAREGGVIDEILVENLYRNKEGNPLILDTILLEKVRNEPNINLLLNTAVCGVEKKSDRIIRLVRGFCSQNSTEYELLAPLFCDASGDGIVSYLSGAAFRMGAESRTEFNEPLAPDKDYGGLLGDSIYFYSKRSDKPVKFIPPAYALDDIKKLPRYRSFNLKDHGCRLWWIEYGGRRDTVHDTEEIKWELWKVIYGIWNYIKNSGRFEDVENLTLEWVGTIPGKRESRRFEGEYILKQQDIVNQSRFYDAVSFGGWALDLHPADGVYSELSGANQWHSKGIYQIPYRCFISRDIDNLFYAGRIISTTHVAFSSSRVMATCALGAQAVGMAAAMCIQNEYAPKDLANPNLIKELQERLNQKGQSIPGIPIQVEKNLINDAEITPSSTLKLDEIPFDGIWYSLKIGAGQMLPLQGGKTYQFQIKVRAKTETILKAHLKKSRKLFNYTPDETLESMEIPISKGTQDILLDFSKQIDRSQYVFLLFEANQDIEIGQSLNRYTGVVSVYNGKNKAVSNNGYQDAPEESGIESFELWTPQRRPDGLNFAVRIHPALKSYDVDFLKNGFTRPYLKTNAWAADLDEKEPMLTLKWNQKQAISGIILFFDTDFDHPLESTLMGHPEDVIPFCVQGYKIFNDKNELVFEERDNHQTVNRVVFPNQVKTKTMKIIFMNSNNKVPVSVFQILFIQ